MSVELPGKLVAFLRDRKALLWICQRAELSPDAQIHDATVPLEDAIGRYRPKPGPETLDLARLFWEACWTESIVDLFYDASEEVAKSGDNDEFSSQKRQPYRLATDPDSEGQIDRRSFLPIYEVNGTDDADDPDGRHGESPARRLAYKMGLIRRLENFPGRALVVVGARESADLDTVRFAFDFIPSNNLVVILWPSDSPIPEDLGLAHRLDIHIFRATGAEFIEALRNIGAPQHTAAPKLAIRYGRSSLELKEDDLLEVDQDFVLIRESDFEEPRRDTEDASELESLWRSEPSDWMPFASDMVFRRHYKPFLDSEQDLASHVISQLREQSNSERVVNMTLTIPASSGSGITTTLRHSAFLAARLGYPALLCKPANQRFSVEKLGAFLNRLQERGREQSIGAEYTPALIVFDRQHRGIEQVSELATILAARGRHALVIEVIPPGGVDADGRRQRPPKGRYLTAEEFRGEVDPEELRSLAEHFSNIYRSLGTPIPTIDDWSAYQERQTMKTLYGDLSPATHFWVALRFFVGQGIHDFNLAEWVQRTYEEWVQDPLAKLAVRYIAAFSSFGIAVPLTPLLRSAGTSKMLDMSILPTLRKVTDSEDLLQWGDSEEDLQDQTVSFKHRLFAIHLLELLGATGWEDHLQGCWGLLESLRAGTVADSWLVEALVFEALRVERPDVAMRDRLPALLETYERIPSVISERSAPTQHHWARALSHKAQNTEEINEKSLLYIRSIKRLELACELAEGTRGREHPRNIYNSLGVMRSEFSRALQSVGKGEKAEELWQSAAAAFDSALRFGSDNFVVLSAYSHRLIQHAKEVDEPKQALSDIANALSHLAQAEEAALLADTLSDDEVAYIELKRNEAWNIVDREQAERHIEELIDNGNEIGIVLKAYRELGDMGNEGWEQGTASQLMSAFKILIEANSGQIQNRSWRSVFLMYRIVSALQSERFDFRHRLQLLDELDSLPFRWYSGLRFAQAVLCYQTSDFRRGFNLFRDLRSKFRSGDLQPMRLTSFLRDLARPSKPRQASIRIQRVQSDWVAYGEVREMNGQLVLTRPRWFDVQPRTGDLRPCYIVFETNGPLAVPTSRRPASVID